MNEKCVNKEIFVTTDHFLRTVEPPVSDHPNAKIELSLTGGGRSQESNHRGSLARRGSEHLLYGR